MFVTCRNVMPFKMSNVRTFVGHDQDEHHGEVSSKRVLLSCSLLQPSTNLFSSSNIRPEAVQQRQQLWVCFTLLPGPPQWPTTIFRSDLKAKMMNPNELLKHGVLCTRPSCPPVREKINRQECVAGGY